MARFKYHYNIGYASGAQEEIVEFPDEVLEGMSEAEREAYIEADFEIWTSNFIDGGWREMEDGEEED